MFELSYYGHSHLVPAGGGGGHTPGAPPVQAHVLGESAPGRKANEHARERGKARSRSCGVAEGARSEGIRPPMRRARWAKRSCPDEEMAPKEDTARKRRRRWGGRGAAWGPSTRYSSRRESRMAARWAARRTRWVRCASMCEVAVTSNVLTSMQVQTPGASMPSTTTSGQWKRPAPAPALQSFMRRPPSPPGPRMCGITRPVPKTASRMTTKARTTGSWTVPERREP